MDDRTPIRRWFLVAALFLILLVAAGLRLYRLPDLPLGLHYDEAANGILAGEIARGVSTPVFIPSYTGKEVLFFYWAALCMKALGVTPLALRLSAVTAGLVTVLVTVWAARELLPNRRDALWVALFTGAFLATSYWHLTLSRNGFRAITQPLLQALTVACLWRGLRLLSCPVSSADRAPSAQARLAEGARQLAGQGRGGLLWLVLAGLFCGLTAYTYLAARAFPIPLGAALLCFLLARREGRHVRLKQLGLFLICATLALVPLVHYWLTHPGSLLNRIRQVGAGSWSDALSGLRACLAMFFIQGDPYIRFNLPGRPIFDPLHAVLFLLGVALTTWYLLRGLWERAGRSSAAQSRLPSAPLQTSSYVFLLSYLPVMLLPSALATGEVTPSNLRAVGLLPFVYLFPALGLAELRSRVLHLGTRTWLRWPVTVLRLSLVVLPFVFLAATTAIAYFRDWASSAALYRAAEGDLVDVAAYLNQVGGSPGAHVEPSELSSQSPVESQPAMIPYVASVHYRHPTLAFLAQDYGAIRWLTGGKTVVVPADRDALLILPGSASDDLAWVQSLVPDEMLVARPSGPDGRPAFHAYRYGPGFVPAPTHPLTVNLAHVALLSGYDVVGEATSGGQVALAVWWRVLSAPDRADYGPIARLTDPWGFVWGEKKPFHYPSEQWSPGELIVDHLALPVAPGTPPGDYRVRFSLYSEQADSQLPVLDEADRFAGLWAELPVHLQCADRVTYDGLDPDDLGIRKRLDARADSLTLLGVNLDTSRARPGERVYLTLFWRADGGALSDQRVLLSLDDHLLSADHPVHGTYPFSDWAAGEYVVDRYDVRLPLDVAAGEYALDLCLSPSPVGSECALALDLGGVTVREVERTFDVPHIAHPLTANLGDQVALLGYDLSAETAAPGDVITLTLYWRALDQPEEDYTVFTHLLAPDGSMTGQQDAYPVAGTYPTSLWMTGEVVVDPHEFSIRADAAPGAHRLEVGLYVAETGDRLAIAGGPGDSVFLQPVNIAD